MMNSTSEFGPLIYQIVIFKGTCMLFGGFKHFSMALRSAAALLRTKGVQRAPGSASRDPGGGGRVHTCRGTVTWGRTAPINSVTSPRTGPSLQLWET